MEVSKIERKILHVDVNNAFLSWTAVDMLANGAKQDIRKIPAVIGGDEKARKGIVLAKSALAKKMKITTGESLFQARKKCPSLQVFPGDFKLYKKMSDAMTNILLEYTDQIERFSIDECFMDMTHFVKSDSELLDKANEISIRIKNELKFTVNIGVAHNKLLAKMASDLEKPDRVHTLFENEMANKIWGLPIEDLFMVGRRNGPKLRKMGIITIGDLAKENKDNIVQKFGKLGSMIWEYANGIDNSEVVCEEQEPKSIGNSITLPYDIKDIDKLNQVILTLSEQVAYRLRKEELLATVVNVQIKTKEFETFSHQKKLEFPTDETKEIYRLAKDLLLILKKNYYIRLLGVRVDNLVQKSEHQISFFEKQEDSKDKKLDLVMDKIKQKYGYDAINHGGTLKEMSSKKYK